jgi:hypothetical protein
MTRPSLAPAAYRRKLSLPARICDRVIARLVEQLRLLRDHELDARHFIRACADRAVEDGRQLVDIAIRTVTWLVAWNPVSLAVPALFGSYCGCSDSRDVWMSRSAMLAS